MNDARLALLARFVAAALSFAFSVVLARALGIEAFGQYSLVLAAVNVGIIVALLGNENIVTRTLAARPEGLDAQAGIALAAYRHRLLRRTWGVGLGLAVLGGGTLVSLDASGFSSLPPAWAGLFLLVPLVARLRLSQSFLRGVHLSALAVLPDGVIRPLFALTMVSVVIVFWPRVEPVAAVLLLASAAVAALALATQWEKRNLPWSQAPDSISARELQLFSAAAFLSSLLAVLDSQLPLMTLGLVASPAETAGYAAADRFAQAAALIAQASYLAVSARIARLYAQGDIEQLRVMVRRVVRGVIAGTLVVTLTIAVLAEVLLRLFGPGFEAAAPTLWVLLLATLCNAAAGPTGLILLMLRLEGLHFRILAISGLAQLALLVVLLAQGMGALGAAIAVLGSKLLWNAAMLMQIRKRLGFRMILAAA